MFDKVTFFLPFNYPSFGEEGEFILSNTILSKTYNKKTRQYYYEGYHKTLRVALYETGFYISNSLSTFLYGHNANDINLEELCKVIKEICELLKCNSNELLIKGFEFGFTFQTDIAANRIMKRMLLHWKKEPKQEVRATHITSTKFYHHNYQLKIYNKAFVEKMECGLRMPGNWIRIEQQFNYKHIPKQMRTAFDLMQVKNIETVFSEFLNQWRKIKKAPFINHINLTRGKVYKIYALQNPLFVEDSLDFRKKDTVKKEQQRFDAYLKQIGDYSTFQKIEEIFTSKFKTLLKNQGVPDFPALLLVENKGQIS